MAGATYDLVVLSSSPPDSRHVAPRDLSPASPWEHRVAMSPTPPAPLSPLTSPKRPATGALRSGSRAAPVPEGLGTGFATARSLLADVSINDKGLSAIEAALESIGTGAGQQGTEKPARKPRKRAAKAADPGDDAEKPKPKPKPRGRKPKTANLEEANGEASKAKTATTTSSYFAKLPPADDGAASTRERAAPPVEPKPTKPRKPRAKKAANDDGETQTTTKKPRVAKPRASSKTTKKVQGLAAEVVSAHFRSRDTGGDVAAPDQEALTNAEDQGSRLDVNSIWDVPLSPLARDRTPEPKAPLDLDEAVCRRRNWTPPCESAHLEILTSSTGKENRRDVSGVETGNFTSLLSGYTYAHMEPPPEQPNSASASTTTIGVMKRRRVQLVDVPGNQAASRQSSPEKGKAPKKKPRTITDLVTGYYAPHDSLPESPAVKSDFFARRPTTSTSTTTKLPLNDIATAETSKGAMKTTRKRSTPKGASENRETKGKSKKGSAKSAAKPKLVADKLLSPTSAVLRMNRQDILFGTSSQLALDETPATVKEIQNAIRASEQDAHLRESLASADVPSIAPWPRLHRIEGRRALWAAGSRDDDGQMLERQDIYLPEPDRTQDIPLLMESAPAKSDDSFLDIDDFAPPPQAPIPISSDLPTPPPTIADGKAVHVDDIAEDSSPFLDIDDFPRDPPPSNQNVDDSFLDIDDFPPSAQVSADFLPRITSTGSPKKRRGRPPKTQSAIPQRITASTRVGPSKRTAGPTSTLTATSPSTPRTGKGRFHDIEEILDSEDDEALSPTPPRIRRLADSPPLPLASDPLPTSAPKDILVPIYRIPESHLTFDALRPTLFPRITSLIRSLAPTDDPSKPSWHEKILMYDAIVVEDFTAFLNTHEEIRMYKRATQKQIKAWNKGKGKAAVAVEEGSGEVLAVKREVEGWVVQKWCEEMSVCCVMREGRKGGVRKGLY